MKYSILSLGLALILSGCGVDGILDKMSPTSSVMGGERYETQGGVDLTFTDSAIKGSGKVVASSPRTSEDSHYQLEFSIGNGGSVTLVSNAASDLDGGLTVRFYRRNNGLLGAVLRTRNEEHDFSDEILSDALGKINVEMDVHGHGHLIVGGLSVDKLAYSISSLNSGRYWGMILDKAEVTKAVASKAEVED